MTTIIRKSMLSVAGLAFAGGIFAGPIAAHAAAPTIDAKPVAVVQADKPDTAKLIPHGTQGEQSRIALNGEQTDDAKAIIAATKKAGLPERARSSRLPPACRNPSWRTWATSATPTITTRWACSSSVLPVVGVRRSRSPTPRTPPPRSSRASSRSTAGRTCP
ncbi:hypothetical protein GCM10027614_34930 [Micromonospora vulcania]